MKKELEENLESIIYIHLDAKYYYRDYKYLCQPDTEEEKKVLNNSFVNRLRNAFWRLAVIELNKLFQQSLNEHFNLISLLKKLINIYEQENLTKELKKNKIQNWLNKLDSQRFIEIRTKLKKQRDEYIAHTDKNPSKPLSEITISFDEFKELINFTEEIIISLQGDYFKTEMDLDVPSMDKAGNILEILYKHIEMRKKEIINKWNEYVKKRN